MRRILGLATLAVLFICTLPVQPAVAEPEAPPPAPSAVTPGGSIAVIKNHNVWLITPDASKSRPITTDGTAAEPYSSPTQSDGRFIAALKNRTAPEGEPHKEGVIHLWDRAGNPQPGWPAPPQQVFRNQGPDVIVALGLADLAISPDGEQLVWTNEWLCPDGNGGSQRCTVVRGRNRTNSGFAFTPQFSREDPAWDGNTRLVMTCFKECGPGGTGGTTQLGIHTLEPNQPESAVYGGDGLTRQPEATLGKLAATRLPDVPGGAPSRLELWSVDAAGPAVNCSVNGNSGEQFDTPSWGPTGSALVFEDRGNLYRQAFGDLASGNCAASVPAFTFLAAASQPDWSPAPYEIATSSLVRITPGDPTQTKANQDVLFVIDIRPLGVVSPTGGVTLMSGITDLGICTIAPESNGSCVISARLEPGEHTLTAHYSGDSTFEPSASPPRAHTSLEPIATSTALTTSANPARTDQQITFTATVAEDDAAAPTDHVRFRVNDEIFGDAPIDSNGVATLTVTLAAGTFTVTAEYLGDAEFAVSTSEPVTQVVNKVPSAVSVSTNPSPSTAGAAVTFTASISEPSAAVPSGTVQFKDGASNLGGLVTVTNGTASMVTNALSTGSHTITAVYSGDAIFSGSTSAGTTHVVNPTGPPPAKRAAADFDDDGDTDIAAFRPSNGTWYVHGRTPVAYGTNGDVPLDADFDNDGDADIAVFRPSKGTWHVQGRASVAYGTQSDIPVPADYDGDGDSDIAVFRPSKGTWHVQGRTTVSYGTKNDIPVPGDYDGDGDAEIAVFRRSTNTWHVQGRAAVAFGTAQDVPVPADYDKDGDIDIAVFRPSKGTWHIQGKPTVAFGTNNDIPIPGDYDKDGDADLAVFRPSTNTWHVQGRATVTMGTSGDIPVIGRTLPQLLP